MFHYHCFWSILDRFAISRPLEFDFNDFFFLSPCGRMCVCQICSGASIKIDLQPASSLLIWRYASMRIWKWRLTTRWGSQGACFLATCLSQYGKLTVLWSGSQSVYVFGVGKRDGESGRKERAERETRERGNERVIPKHLKKHFPLSYHLDVVSGTRSTNVFPRSAPPPSSSAHTVQGRGKGNLYYFFSPWSLARSVTVDCAHMDKGPVGGGCDAEIDPCSSGGVCASWRECVLKRDPGVWPEGMETAEILPGPSQVVVVVVNLFFVCVRQGGLTMFCSSHTPGNN